MPTSKLTHGMSLLAEVEAVVGDVRDVDDFCAPQGAIARGVEQLHEWLDYDCEVFSSIVTAALNLLTKHTRVHIVHLGVHLGDKSCTLPDSYRSNPLLTEKIHLSELLLESTERTIIHAGGNMRFELWTFRPTVRRSSRYTTVALWKVSF